MGKRNVIMITKATTTATTTATKQFEIIFHKTKTKDASHHHHNNNHHFIHSTSYFRLQFSNGIIVVLIK
jgi:hypothetical protein